MTKKNKRPLYRRTSKGDVFIKILTDGTFIAVFESNMFKIAGIERNSLTQLRRPDELQKCLKSEFMKAYRQAKDSIKSCLK